MLTARTTEQDYVEAGEALRGVGYFCRGCDQPVILHAGRIRPWHFQHRPDTACVLGSKMSEAHLNAQLALAGALRDRDAHVELESWLPGLTGDRRIDVLAHPTGRPDRRVAIEVQQADITVEAIAARTASYQAASVAPLWLRLLNFDRLDAAQALTLSGEVWVDRYAAHSWERWVHDQAGALWFYDAGTGRLWRGRFTPAYGWREGSEWYEPGGEYNSNPGGYFPVNRWVGLALEGPYSPAALKLKRGRLGRALLAWFVPPEGSSSPPPLRRELRTEWKPTYPREICELEHCIGGGWVTAVIDSLPDDWRRVGITVTVHLIPPR